MAEPSSLPTWAGPNLPFHRHKEFYGANFIAAIRCIREIHVLADAHFVEQDGSQLLLT